MSARTFDPRLSPGENMSRMKLGLFGAARPTDGRLIVNEADPIVADTRERLAGLTPVEIAAAEAMSQTSVATLTVR